MILGIVYQISGQDNVSYKSTNHIGKRFSRSICFIEGFVCYCPVNNFAAKQNSTNSVKLEPRIKQSCKILIVLLWIPFLDI